MNKTDTYNAIVKEVTDSIGLIKPSKPEYGSFLEAVQDKGKTARTVELPKDIASLASPLSAFADYDIRDSLICKSLNDENFAFVLVNKVAGAVVDNEDNLSQNDIEALAFVANVTCMWEQFNHAVSTLTAISDMASECKLDVPPLAQITVQLLNNYKSFPFEEARKGTIKLLDELEARLGTNKEGE